MGTPLVSTTAAAGGAGILGIAPPVFHSDDTSVVWLAHTAIVRSVSKSHDKIIINTDEYNRNR